MGELDRRSDSQFVARVSWRESTMDESKRRRDPLLPFVRHMLLCDDVRPVAKNSRKVTVYGLTSTIRIGDKGFPATYGFSVYLQLTEGRGEGRGRIVVVDSQSGERCYEGHDHRLVFGSNPLKVYGALIRIPQCEFPGPGLFWVEFWYEERLLSREPMLVR
jgi:hypothetical protein